MNNMVKTCIFALLLVTLFAISGEAQKKEKEFDPVKFSNVEIYNKVLKSNNSTSIETFEGVFPPSGWKLINPNSGSYTFAHFIGTNGPSLSGLRCVKMDFYNYSNNGHKDTLKTPVYTALSDTDSVRFDWAYCQYPGYNDRLQVIMSTDNGATFNQIIFDKSGAALGTVPSSQSSFTPNDSSQWKKFSYSFSGLSNVSFAFVTTNNYGNNLYIDNLTVGRIPVNDVAPLEFSNILPDTSYKENSFTPKVLVGNFGQNPIVTTFSVTVQIEPGGYSSTKSISALNIGQNSEVTFDSYVAIHNTPLTLKIFTSHPADSNRANDTIIQYSTFFMGFPKTVLFEQWTSSTCGPCAASNPSIDAFLATHDDNLLAIKYHVGWPSPGNDPMYLHNPMQSYDRRYYYGVNAVPTLIMEGRVNGIPPNEYLFKQSMLKGSPANIAIRSVKKGEDSIRAIFIVTLNDTLPTGNYYLRSYMIEKQVHYTTAPGTNGEKDFYDVFRHAVPSTLGTLISNSPGSYRYEYTFNVDPTEIDSNIYIGAFIQNDVNKSIVNSSKSGRAVEPDTSLPTITAGTFWSTILPNYLDLFAACDEIMDSMRAVFTLQDTAHDTTYTANVNMERIHDSLFVASYRINDKGILNITIYGRDFEGNKTQITKNYSVNVLSKTKQTIISGNQWSVFADKNITDKEGYIFVDAESNSDRSKLCVNASGNNIYPVSNEILISGSVPLITGKTYSISVKPDLNNMPSVNKNEMDKIRIYCFKNGKWVPLMSKCSGGMIDANVDAYCGYRLFYDPTQVPVPQNLELIQNYPNPFNPSTTIRYALPAESDIQLTVYNILGQQVRNLVHTRQVAGYYEIIWDGKNNNGHLAGSGLYIYQIKANGLVKSKKMILLK